jgi:ribosomal protein S18 acetylase RimI-like enzyme
MKPDPLEVRIIRGEDVPRVVELWRTVFPDDPSRNDPALMAQRKLEFEPELFLVGEKDGRLVAAVMAGYDGVRGWIYHLAVDPDERRQGFGKKMMQAAEEMMMSLGCPKVNLQIRSSNEGVIEFYEAIGYKVEDRVSMGKPLS